MLKKVVSVVIDAERKHAEGITKEIRNALDKKEIEDAIVTVRVEGCLREGKVSDIPFMISLHAKGLSCFEEYL